MRWERVLVGTLLSAGLAAPTTQAQDGGDRPGASAPVVISPLGIPVGTQIIDVPWSGDRMGEFTVLTTLPPAFRRAEGHTGPAAPRPAPVQPTPTPTPAPLTPARS